MKHLSIAIVGFLLAGNAKADNWFVEAAAAYPLPQYTELTGRPPMARLCAGYEWTSLEVGYCHTSFFRDGPPWNDRPETTNDYLYISKRFRFWGSN
jgi:hypothetical protein